MNDTIPNIVRRLLNIKVILPIILSILVFIPFLWLKPGEMDLGGDGSRLYFYDPVNYLKYTDLYSVLPIGPNKENPLYLFLPFNLLLIGLIKILGSQYLIITLFNSFHLVAGFLAMYAITKELLSVTNKNKDHRTLIELTSLFVGIYYIISPLMVRTEWERAIFTHARIFLGPLIFYLLLKFFLSKKTYFLLLILIITLIFSTNFSWAGSPSFFSFYPLAVIYLFLYVKIIRKIKIHFKPLMGTAVLFFTLHSFHLLPFIFGVLDKSNLAYQKIARTGSDFNSGLEYFLGSARNIHLTDNLIGLPQLVPSIVPYEFLFFTLPLMLIVALLINVRDRNLLKEQQRNYLLLFVFFLLSLFLATANVTNIGFSFYKTLFNIPGFSMFRNYYGDFALPYLFFFSLLIGQAFFYVLIRLKRSYQRYGLFIVFLFLVFASAWPFIRGDMINVVLNKGQKIEFKVPIKMDPTYEDVLNFIRAIPIDGKFLTLPHTESFNQVLVGEQQGMYIGPSTISHLTGKSDYNGYQVIAPFNEILLKLSREKKYQSIDVLLSLLNVKYIFYNSDLRILEYFADAPYVQHLKDSLPTTQQAYRKFIHDLSVTENRSFGDFYHFYMVDDEFYLPHIYVAKRIDFFDEKFDPWENLTDVFFSYNKDTYETRSVYVPDTFTNFSTSSAIPQITFTKINPTKYKIEIQNATEPYILIFSDAFNPRWNIFLSDSTNPTKEKIAASYFNGEIKEGNHKIIFLEPATFETWNKNPIAQKNHFRANAYANGWYITPNDADGKTNYTLILEMTAQRVFYVSLVITLVGIAACMIWLSILLLKRIKK